jgi:chorismate synthase
MNHFGKNLQVTLFGSSHGVCVGATIDSYPAGILLPTEEIKHALQKRSGEETISTPRREKDEVEYLSGVFENKTTGAPLTFIIKNQNVDDSVYEKGIIRPSHADYTNHEKYHGFEDYRGGGSSSGRMTAPLVVVGCFMKELLKSSSITFYGRISSVGSVHDVSLDNLNNTVLEQTLSKLDENFPVVDIRGKALMKSQIEKAKKEGDSLGGTLDGYLFHVPTGLGEPFFDSIESILSHLFFSIPGVKAIEFGDGFLLSTKKGSETLDAMEYDEEKKVSFLSNHQGGINGGISNGNTIHFRLGVRAPSSIQKPISSINTETRENIMVATLGRHDPTIVHRVLPVVEALTYFAVADFLIEMRHHS